MQWTPFSPAWTLIPTADCRLLLHVDTFLDLLSFHPVGPFICVEAFSPCSCSYTLSQATPKGGHYSHLLGLLIHPMTPSGGSIICWNNSQNSENHLHLLVYYKTKDLEKQPDEKVYRVRSRKVLSARASPWYWRGVCHPPSTGMCSPAQKFSKSYTLGVFMEALSCRHEPLTQSLASLSSLEDEGWTESSKLPIMVMSCC